MEDKVEGMTEEIQNLNRVCGSKPIFRGFTRPSSRSTTTEADNLQLPIEFLSVVPNENKTTKAVVLFFLRESILQSKEEIAIGFDKLAQQLNFSRTGTHTGVRRALAAAYVKLLHLGNATSKSVYAVNWCDANKVEVAGIELDQKVSLSDSYTLAVPSNNVQPITAPIQNMDAEKWMASNLLGSEGSLIPSLYVRDSNNRNSDYNRITINLIENNKIRTIIESPVSASYPSDTRETHTHIATSTRLNSLNQLETHVIITHDAALPVALRATAVTNPTKGNRQNYALADSYKVDGIQKPKRMAKTKPIINPFTAPGAEPEDKGQPAAISKQSQPTPQPPPSAVKNEAVANGQTQPAKSKWECRGRKPLPQYLRNLMFDFNRELGDLAHVHSNFSQVANLFAESGLSEQEFADAMYASRKLTHQFATYRQGEKPAAPGQPRNTAAYFFKVLRDQLGKPDESCQLSPAIEDDAAPIKPQVIASGLAANTSAVAEVGRDFYDCTAPASRAIVAEKIPESFTKPEAERTAVAPIAIDTSAPKPSLST